MHKLICFLLVFLLFFSYGCPINSGMDVKVSTDKDVYNINEAVIVYIENERNSTVYFYHCNYNIEFYVEKKEDSVWVVVFGNAGICFFFDEAGIIELAPGEKDTTEITDWNWTPGVYRIFAPYRLEETGANFTELSYSKEFTFQ